MGVFKIVLLTLIIYSFVSTVLFFAFDKNEILEFFGLGIVGGLLLLIVKFFSYLKQMYKKNFTYALIMDKNNKMYKCKMKHLWNLWDSGQYDIVYNYVNKNKCMDFQELKAENKYDIHIIRKKLREYKKKKNMREIEKNFELIVEDP